MQRSTKTEPERAAKNQRKRKENFHWTSTLVLISMHIARICFDADEREVSFKIGKGETFY